MLAVVCPFSGRLSCLLSLPKNILFSGSLQTLASHISEKKNAILDHICPEWIVIIAYQTTLVRLEDLCFHENGLPKFLMRPGSSNLIISLKLIGWVTKSWTNSVIQEDQYEPAISIKLQIKRKIVK